MAKEIERKFLVNLELVDNLNNGSLIKQGYLPTVGNSVVRVRLKGDSAYLTLKGETVGMTRSEFEYEIPVEDATQMIDELCEGPSIEKMRYEIPYADHVWEVDIFQGDNEGLVIAEVELENENEFVDLPLWLVQEVTGQTKYYNSQLLTHPYSKWSST